ncbi:MAG: hypothetical protein K6E18_00050 [Lachnospiraceae bacterium]|nr:hypothetical protein [Lachnospiraceae bacterium]
MKKRFLCALLTSTLCVATALPAAAAITGSVSLNDASAPVVTFEAEEELDAEGAPAQIVRFYGLDPSVYTYGKEVDLELVVSPEGQYTVAIYKNGECIDSYTRKAPASTDGRDVKTTIKLAFNDTATWAAGDYVMKLWGGDATNTAAISAAKAYPFSIKRSLVPADNSAITIKPDETTTCYTGNDVAPKFIIKDKIDNQEVTLVQGTDFDVQVIGNNTKKVGTATAKITGKGKYTGEKDEQFLIRPRAPKLPTAECASNTAVKLTWNKIAEATGYQVFRRNESGTFTKVGDCQGNTTTDFVDTKLTSGTEYEYQILSVADDDFAISQVTSAVYTTGTKITVTTATPKFSEVTNISTTKVKLTWGKVEGAKGYNVYRVNKKGKLKLVKKNLKKNTYKVGKLTCGKTYKFTVKAYVLGGDNGKTRLESAQAPTKEIQAKPVAPKLTEAKSAGSTKVALKWKRISDCTGYLVYRKPVGEDEDWKLIATVTGSNTLTYTDDKAQTGVKYAYTLASYKQVRKKKVKSLMDAKGIRVYAVSEGPSIVTEQRRENKANIFIKNVPGADGYYLYKKAGDGKYALVATLTRGAGDWTIYGDMNVAVGTTYTYYAEPYTDTDDKRVKGQKGAEATLVMKSLTATTKK